MTRTLLVLLCIAVLLLVLWAMRLGWRHRAARQSELAPLPQRPAAPGAVLVEPTSGLYVGTSYAASWQDRVVVSGFGLRADAVATSYDSGVLIDRTGAGPVFIPAAEIVEARLAPGLAGKVVGAGGLLVIRWRLGDELLDTGFRADDKAGYPAWVRTINERVSVQ